MLYILLYPDEVHATLYNNSDFEAALQYLCYSIIYSTINVFVLFRLVLYTICRKNKAESVEIYRIHYGHLLN